MDFFGAVSKSLCDRYFAANRLDHQDYGLPPEAANGHDGFRRVLGDFFDAFPDLRLARVV